MKLTPLSTTTLAAIYIGIVHSFCICNYRSPGAIKVSLHAAPEGMKWFVKTETFSKPYPEVKQYLEEHRRWVRLLREEGNVKIASGYRVDENDKPGGGGLMIFAATDYAAAEKFVRGDPLISNECVDWQLNRWIPETGDVNIE